MADPILQTKFMQPNENSVTKRKDIYTFNPTYASKELPDYQVKEKSYGDYDTSLNSQKQYSNNFGTITGKDVNGNQWSKNLSDIAQTVESGKQSQNTQQAYNNTNQTINSISNTLKTQPQQRNVQEGYTEADLNKMAENGFNTLNEGYQNALDKAAANYNRLGLRGSGFELADEFGNQSDSITSNYLKNLQQLQNEIASKGLEAARQDRYANAEANEKNYQNWIQNLGNLANTQQTFADKQNASDLSWLQNMQNVAFQNKDYLAKAIDINKGLADQSNTQQLKWGELNGGLAKNDDESVMKRWEGGVDVDKNTVNNQYDVYKTLLQVLGAAATGSNENYGNMITQLNEQPEWLKPAIEAILNNNNK